MTRILIIDDEARLRKAMEQALVDEEHFVCTTEDGRHALGLFAAQPFDLVITDILMPAMDGLEIIQALRQMNPTVPIIAVSAGGMADAELYLGLARKLGGTAVLTKPFLPAELREVVHRLLAEATSPNGVAG